MGLYERYLLPKFIGCACGAKPIMRQRRKIVPLAEGETLEIGIGAGHNLKYYESTRVTRVVGLEPLAPLRDMAAMAARPDGLKLDLVDGLAEAMPFETGRFDSIVCTFTLCSVASVERVLAEARRVLKPGGVFLFCEHGLAPDADVAVWQRRLDPLWKRIAGNCHLSRPVAKGIAANGFSIDKVETMYLPGTPRFAGWNEWGAARVA
jgi:SAM-dependent methyltransferase